MAHAREKPPKALLILCFVVFPIVGVTLTIITLYATGRLGSSAARPGDPSGVYKAASARHSQLLGHVAREPNRAEDLVAVARKLEGVKDALLADSTFEFHGLDLALLDRSAFDGAEYGVQGLDETQQAYRDAVRKHEAALAWAQEYMRRADELDLITELSRLRDSHHFVVDLRVSIDPERLSLYRELARYLVTRGSRAVRVGNTADAIVCFGHALWLGDNVSRQGPYTDYLTGLAILDLAVAHTSRAVPRLEPGDLEHVRTVAAQYRDFNSSLISFEMSRFEALAMIVASYREDRSGDGAYIDPGVSNDDDDSLVIGRDRAREVVNRFCDELLRTRSLSPSERSIPARELAFKPDTGTQMPAALSGFDRVLAQAIDWDDLERSRIALLETQIAIELFRRQNGQLPPDLGSLVPDFLLSLPHDPFAADAAVRYRVDPAVEGGFWLWAVGTDREDNGGARTEHGAGGSVSGTDLVLWPPFVR
ncbi:MAG: hypothetical protein H6811_11325 [Phycisphaeraceae bacterium]|nr:hypothetical protein [Phycisphaeraceae bacterium]